MSESDRRWLLLDLNKSGARAKGCGQAGNECGEARIFVV